MLRHAITGVLTAAGAVQAQTFGNGERHTYSQRHTVSFNYHIQDTAQNNPTTRLDYASGKWDAKIEGRAFRGGTDLNPIPPGCVGQCPCDFVTHRDEPPPFGDSKSYFQQYFRPTGGLFSPPAMGGSSGTAYVGSSVSELLGRFYATFGAVGDDPGVTGAVGLTTDIHLQNASGTITFLACCGPCMSTAGCSAPYSYYVDHAKGSDITTETFTDSFNPGSGQLTVHLFPMASATTSTLKKDYWTYLPSGGTTQCIDETCVGTPTPLTFTTTQKITVSVYQRLGGTGPTPGGPPVLGALLTQAFYNGSVTTTGSSVTGTGVFASMTCGQGCPDADPHPVETTCDGVPTTIGHTWSISRAASPTFAYPVNNSGAIVIVVKREIVGGN